MYLARFAFVLVAVGACHGESAREEQREISRVPARQVDRLEPHRDAWRTSRIAGTRDAERSLLNRRVPTRMPAHTRIEQPTRIEPPRELVSRPDVDDRVGGDQ